MLHDALDFVAAFAALKGLSERDLLRLQLVIEELFTNTIMHGYGKECDEPIEIALRAAPGQVTVQYEDAAGPYDPARTLAASPSRCPGRSSSGRSATSVFTLLPRSSTICATRASANATNCKS